MADDAIDDESLEDIGYRHIGNVELCQIFGLDLGRAAHVANRQIVERTTLL